MQPWRPLMLANGESAPRQALPLVDLPVLHGYIADRVRDGARLYSLHAIPGEHQPRLLACLGNAELGMLELASASLPDRFPSLTPECTAAHWFERELAEQWAVVPQGHPWLQPIRFHRSRRDGRDAWGRSPEQIEIGRREFWRVEGEEVHEVAVGPVHAGVIEPGHFRFQCHGETVFHLEISLGYQHRGVEDSLVGVPSPRTAAVAETIAGDTTVGHATAWCRVLEALSGTSVPPRADAIRALALELERMANHTGDLGALAGDVAYLPTASFCGRLRGDILNMTAALCGNRFGRGLIRPGGVRFDVDDELATDLGHRLAETMRDLTQAVNLLWDKPSVLSRFEGMGALSRDLALQVGLLGPSARACGLEHDVRADFPVGHYRFAQVPVSTWDTGDVFARAFVRWLELQRSAEFVRDTLALLPAGDLQAAPKTLRPDRIAVALVEGWRGAICHVAVTGPDGTVEHAKVVDPSFHNWFGLAMALRNNPISEFPLCNKSFNLSYCGHDL